MTSAGYLRRLALLAALAATLFLALAPAYSSGATLLERNAELSVRIALFAPLGLCGLAMLPLGQARKTVERVIGVGLIALNFVTVIGLFFTPAGVLLLLAAAKEAHQRPARYPL